MFTVDFLLYEVMIGIVRISTHRHNTSQTQGTSTVTSETKSAGALEAPATTSNRSSVESVPLAAENQLASVGDVDISGGNTAPGLKAPACDEGAAEKAPVPHETESTQVAATV